MQISQELVNYYYLESSLGSFRLAVENEGETGIRDLILEIQIDKCGDKFALYSDYDKPDRPRAPVKRLSSVAGAVMGEINISGDHNIVYNVHGAAANDVFIEENEDNWSLKFEIPVVQPKRTVVSNVQFWIGAVAPCSVKLNATVFSSQATPFKIQSDFDFSVSEKRMTYSEILELLGEDLSEFTDAG